MWNTKCSGKSRQRSLIHGLARLQAPDRARQDASQFGKFVDAVPARDAKTKDPIGKRLNRRPNVPGTHALPLASELPLCGRILEVS